MENENLQWKRYNLDCTCNYNDKGGIRILVFLKSDVLLKMDVGDGSVENPYEIVQK